MISYKDFKNKPDDIPVGIVDHDQRHQNTNKPLKEWDEWDGYGGYRYTPQVQKLHKRLSDKYTFNHDEKDVLEEYRGKSFELNAHLLGHHMFGEPTEHVLTFHHAGDSRKNTLYNYDLRAMDGALNRRTGESFKVFSGLGFNPTKQLDKHGRIHFPAYTSTSLAKDTAASFMYPDEDGNRHMLRVHINPHDHGAYIGHVQGADEKEFLLPRGTTLKIHNQHNPEIDEEGTRIWHATVEHDIDPHDISHNPEHILKLNKNYLRFLHKDKNTHPKLKEFLDDHVHNMYSVDDVYELHDPKVLHKLASSPEPYIREAVAHNTHTHHDTLDLLSNDSHLTTKIRVSSNPNTSSSTLQKMMKPDIDEEILSNIAAHRNANGSMLHKLSTHDRDGIRVGVVMNNNTLPHTLNDMAFDKRNHHTFILSRLLRNKNTPAITLDRFKDNSYYEVRVAVAQHPNTPERSLNHLSDDPHLHVRKILAANPNISYTIMRKLANDKINGVKEYLSSNLNIPSPILHHLYTNNQTNSTIISNIIDHKNTSSETLHELSKHPDHWTVSRVAQHPNMSSDTLRELSDHHSTTVRRAVASHSNISIHTLYKMKDDKSESVRQEVAQNPKTTLDILQHLRHDPSYEVKQSVFRHPKATQEMKDAIQHDIQNHVFKDIEF